MVSLDARRAEGTPSGYEVTTHGGRTGTGICAVAWAREVAERGAGEILLTSMDADGTTNGFDIEMLKTIRGEVSLPIIASGGAGTAEHFVQAARAGADAAGSDRRGCHHASGGANWLRTSTPRSSSCAATNSLLTRFIPSCRLVTTQTSAPR